MAKSLMAKSFFLLLILNSMLIKKLNT